MRPTEQISRIAGLTILAAVSLSGFSAQAQDEARLQNVVVTGQRVGDTDGMDANPQIFLRVPAEFVQLDVTCQSATRDASDRKTELNVQFNKLLNWAAGNDGFEFNGGEAGYEMIPIETVSFDEILQINYNNTSRFSLVLMVDVRDGETFDTLKKRTIAAIDSVDAAGRVECFTSDDQYLGIRGLDKHRADLLEKIADDVDLMKRVFGAKSVKISGLESRVISRASGTLTMDVFIPYKMSIETGK